MKKLFLSLAAFLALGSVASAQCQTGTCQVRRSSPVHASSAVVYTYPTTNQYPTYEIQTVAPVAVPIAIPVLVPAYQYQYMPACAPASQSSDQDRMRMMAKALMAEMGKNQDDDGPPVAKEFVPSVPTVNFTNVLSTRCAECHTGQSAKAGVMIFSSPGIFNPRVDRQRILRAVEDGRMPPKAVNDPSLRLTPGEVAILRDAFK